MVFVLKRKRAALDPGPPGDDSIVNPSPSLTHRMPPPLPEDELRRRRDAATVLACIDALVTQQRSLTPSLSALEHANVATACARAGVDAREFAARAAVALLTRTFQSREQLATHILALADGRGNATLDRKLVGL